jgi:hypothetical protein
VPPRSKSMIAVLAYICLWIVLIVSYFMRPLIAVSVWYSIPKMMSSTDVMVRWIIRARGAYKELLGPDAPKIKKLAKSDEISKR